MSRYWIPGWSVGLVAGCLCAAQGVLGADTPAPPSADASPPPSAGAEAPTTRFSPLSDGLPRDGRWKSTPLIADLNGDDLPDLAAHPRLATGARAWLGDGKGGWREASDGLRMSGISCGGGIETADVNGDGKADLVVADHCQGVFVYLGDGAGGWRAAAQALAPAIASDPAAEIAGNNPFRGSEDVAVGDIDGDGRADLIATAADRGGFTVYLGDGTGGGWREHAGHGLPRGAEQDDEQRGGWANELLLRDMDGDGHPDLVASYYLGPRVWRGDGKGGFSSWSEGLPAVEQGGVYRRLAVGDLDGDGRPDLAVSRMNGPVGVYLQQPHGGFRDVTPDLAAVALGSEGIAIGDITGDGAAELLLGVRPEGSVDGYGLLALRRTPGGAWERLVLAGLPLEGQQVVWGLAIGDATGDGRAELAVTIGGEMFAPRAKPGDGSGPVLPHVQVWENRGHAMVTLAATGADASAAPASGAGEGGAPPTGPGVPPTAR